MIEVKYINGYPTKKCLQEILDAFWGDWKAPRISSYWKGTHSIVWQVNGINERVDEFVGHLQDLGIDVRDYNLYDHTKTLVGQIKIKEKIK